MNRRNFLFTLAGLGLTSTAYARYFEPEWFETSLHIVKLPRLNLSTPIRLLHLSDFHFSGVVPLSLIDEAIELGLALRPDLICITGDFVTRFIPNKNDYCKILRKLSDTVPSFASLGNHDGGHWVFPRGGYEGIVEISTLLADSGIQCLNNSSQVVRLNQQELLLIGLGDLWAREFDAPKAFSGENASLALPRIMLSHNPDTKDLLVQNDWDLMLSGHTHGGQIELPFFGTPFAPVRDRRFVKGLHTWNGRLIHVSKGVGSVFGIRINCRPEVSLITLT